MLSCELKYFIVNIFKNYWNLTLTLIAPQMAIFIWLDVKTPENQVQVSKHTRYFSEQAIFQPEIANPKK